MKKPLSPARMFTLLFLTTTTPACKLLDQYCVGDCPESMSGSGDQETLDPTDVTVTSDGETTDGRPGDTASDTGADTSPPHVDPAPTCDIVDTIVAGPTCGNNSVEPGELCYVIGAGGIISPMGVVSVLAARLDDAGIDLLVTHTDKTASARLFAAGPGLTFSDVPWPTPFAADGLFPGGAGDFDGDGDLDVAARIDEVEDRIAILLVDGAGGIVSLSVPFITEQTSEPSVVDWNNDGHLDLVVTATPDGDGDNVFVLLGDGAAEFVPTPLFAHDGALDPHVVAALDDDQHTDDLVFAGPDGILSIFPSPVGSPIFQTDLNGPIVDVATGDLDGDGRGDIVALVDGPGLTRQLVVMRQPAGPGVAVDFTRARYNVHCNAAAVVIADVDADGALDLATISPDTPTSLVTLLRGDGDGDFPDVLTVPMPDPSKDLLIADLNSDGAPELITFSGTVGSVSIAPATP